MLAVLTDAMAAVIAAAVGAAVALVAALIERLVRQKPPWHDELLGAAARFLAEAKALQSIAVRLDPNYERQHHRIVGADRPQGVRSAEEHLFLLRATYQQLVILGSYDAQRHGRDAIEHAWRTIEVYGYEQPDERRAEWGDDRKPEERLDDSLECFAIAVRGTIRVRQHKVIYTRGIHATERAERKRLVALSNPPAVAPAPSSPSLLEGST